MRLTFGRNRIRAAEAKQSRIRCSFCGKHHSQTLKLISGPQVYICSECIALCDRILAEEAANEPAENSASFVQTFPIGSARADTTSVAFRRFAEHLESLHPNEIVDLSIERSGATLRLIATGPDSITTTVESS